MELPRGAAGLILQAVQQDGAAIAKLFGTRTLKSLSDVASEFGVELSTVKDWRKAGMPGSPGALPLGQIFLWKLRRVISMPQFTTSSGDTSQNDLDRKRAADARLAEANAERREQENRIAAGNLLFRDAVEREMATVVIAARESFMRLPREMLPRFPRGVAQDLSDELKSLIVGKLRVLAKRRLSWESGTPATATDPPAADGEKAAE